MKVKERTIELENSEFLVTADDAIGRDIDIYIKGKKVTFGVGLILDGNISLLRFNEDE